MGRPLLICLMVSLLLVGAGCFFGVPAPVFAATPAADTAEDSADGEEDDASHALPRFAMLASPEVNLRTGPGKRYPIDWVIRRKGLPVEIVQEFEHWRKVRLQDGTLGWAHKVMLNNYRACVVTGTAPQSLRAKPDAESRIQARLEPGVLCRLERCQDVWCQAKVQGFEGWLPKKSFWGVYKDEAFEN